MNKKDLKNKKVVVMGLGLHGGGVGSARFMAKAGARVLVTDLKKESELKESINQLREFKNIKYILGQHRMEDFKTAGLIIKNPGVPEDSRHLQVALNNKVPIDTDIGIFFEFCPAQIIGVTGSKGKSTTGALISEVLKTVFQSVFFAGNNRVSVLDILSEVRKRSVVVLELSSWQLEGLATRKKSPHIAVITNIFDEHLNRYKSLEDYQEAKALIFKWQDENDILILNKALRPLSFFEKIKSQIRLYSGENEDAAREIGKIYEIPEERVEKAIIDFRGLPGRMEKILESNDLTFINDTCATHPSAVIRALDSLSSKKIILIAGGVDKKMNFLKLNEAINNRVKTLVLLPGDASEKIKVKIPILKVLSMAEAVSEAIKSAVPGDTIILSPGAASFNLFKHEFHRGEEFTRYVKQTD